jgi:hypothetical protein
VIPKKGEKLFNSHSKQFKLLLSSKVKLNCAPNIDEELYSDLTVALQVVIDA